MKIPIKPSKTYQKFCGNKKDVGSGRGIQIPWTKAMPFASNKRGVLSHRVRSVTTYLFDDRRHHHIDYLCGNGCNVAWDDMAKTLVDDPGERLLCERCEIVARLVDLPSGDTLAGRHVHRGVLVPQQTCCKGEH